MPTPLDGPTTTTTTASGSATTPKTAPPYSSEEDRDFRIMAEAAARKEVQRETFGYGLHSTALQIKDQEKSKWFYTTVLGMEVVKETEMHDVTMIFLAFPNPPDREDADLEFGQRRGLIQLIHVADSETDPTFKVKHQSPGFCHTCVSVPDLEQAMHRMKKLGVTVVEEGSNEMGFGAIADPDGYNIQLLHCQIDQSLALKRQLEEMMSTTASSSSSNGGRRPSVFSSHKDMSLDDLTRSISISSGGPQALNGFRGGSPDLEHPHWMAVRNGASTEGANLQPSSLVAPAGSPAYGATTPSPTAWSPASNGAAAAAATAGPSSSPHRHARADSQQQQQQQQRPSRQPLAPSSSFASTSTSSSTSTTPSHPTPLTTTHKHLTSAKSSATRRSSSPGSIHRPNAPRSINLSDLTSGRTSSFLSRKSQQGSILLAGGSATPSPTLPVTRIETKSAVPTPANTPPAYAKHKGSWMSSATGSSSVSPSYGKAAAAAAGSGAANGSNGNASKKDKDKTSSPSHSTSGGGGSASKKDKASSSSNGAAAAAANGNGHGGGGGGAGSSFRNLRDRLAGRSSASGSK